jgi:hypothetical protein
MLLKLRVRIEKKGEMSSLVVGLKNKQTMVYLLMKAREKNILKKIKMSCKGKINKGCF